MKKILFLATIFGATSIGMYALDLPAYARTQAQNQSKGSQGQGQRQMKKGGPMDGSGPIHTPGTGGGTGQQQGNRRGGRK